MLADGWVRAKGARVEFDMSRSCAVVGCKSVYDYSQPYPSSPSHPSAPQYKYGQEDHLHVQTTRKHP